MSAAKTTSERVDKLRQTRADLGLKRKEVYVHDDDWPEVLRFVEKLARRSDKRAKKTPRQLVVARYPEAYAVQYESVVCVYQKPAQAVPRGLMAEAVVIGMAANVRSAWIDAANRLPARRKTPNVR